MIDQNRTKKLLAVLLAAGAGLWGCHDAAGDADGGAGGGKDVGGREGGAGDGSRDGGGAPDSGRTDAGQIRSDAGGDAADADGGAPTPFWGVNNEYAGSGSYTRARLDERNVGRISDHFRRSRIEPWTNGCDQAFDAAAVTYDFASEVDGMAAQYAGLASWMVVNVESKCAFGDGVQVPKSDHHLVAAAPGDDSPSTQAWEAFLAALVDYTLRVGWRIEAWSIDNEFASLYVPAYDADASGQLEGCGSPSDTECVRAARAHAELVRRSAAIIRQRVPGAKICPGGIAGGTPPEEYDFYWQVYRELKRIEDDGGCAGRCLDFLDYHDFNLFTGYETNYRAGYGPGYFRGQLDGLGFADRAIWLKAGDTHTGIDASGGDRIAYYQTQAQAAGYLIKRLIHHRSSGVEVVLFGPIVESRDSKDPHDIFALNGLVFDGLPLPEECDPESAVWQPCPDPGNGTAKLGDYAFRLFSEHASGADFSSVVSITDANPEVRVYRAARRGKDLYFAWWDYFTSRCAREGAIASCVDSCVGAPGAGYSGMEACVTGCDDACIQANAPTLELPAGPAQRGSVVTLVPAALMGSDVPANWRDASVTQLAPGATVKVPLRTSPVIVQFE